MADRRVVWCGADNVIFVQRAKGEDWECGSVLNLGMDGVNRFSGRDKDIFEPCPKDQVLSTWTE